MKFIKPSLLTIACFALALGIHAQTTADEIINAYFDAIGGRDKIGQINSVYIESSMEVMGNSSPSKITILNGKGYKNEMSFGGSDIVQALTDTGGWMINPYMGSPEPAPIPNDQYVAMKQAIFVAGPLYDYAKKGYSANFTGMDVIDGKPVYKIEAVSPDSIKSTFYIDSATHYMAKAVIDANGQVTTSKYSNFQKTDFGNVIPYSEELTVPQGFQIAITVGHVEINKPVDPAIFEMPKKQ